MGNRSIFELDYLPEQYNPSSIKDSARPQIHKQKHFLYSREERSLDLLLSLIFSPETYEKTNRC